MPDFHSYTVKKSRRARMPRLQITRHGTLEVIIPLRFDAKKIPQLLATHDTWIKKTLSKISKNGQKPGAQPLSLPEKIFLSALNETWTVSYIHHAQGRGKIQTLSHDLLMVKENTANKPACTALLEKWLRKKAGSFLASMLATLRDETGLNYQNFILRGQRARWGSCNINKTISLNYKLVFLPENLVRHIILHELAHTVHLNHSTAFWELLAALDPHWRTHRAALRSNEMLDLIPSWLG